MLTLFLSLSPLNDVDKKKSKKIVGDEERMSKESSFNSDRAEWNIVIIVGLHALNDVRPALIKLPLLNYLSVANYI